MYHFCTYFDQGYLQRGLALYASLRRHCVAFRLWILCLDEVSYDILISLALPGVELIHLADFERDDEELLHAKSTRTNLEYYFTCTPSLPLYILQNWPEVDLITYLDADLYFFADPQPLFDEIGTGSIAIIAHRFTPQMRRLAQNGIYNVGWLSFRRDTNGDACLHWWRKRCNEWCYDRYEPGRFADQKYLDDWPHRFAGVVILKHKGANLAPWNIANYQITAKGEQIRVDQDHLIFFHFHAFQQIQSWLYSHRFYLYKTRPTEIVLRQIYVPYIHTFVAMLPTRTPQIEDRYTRGILKWIYQVSQWLVSHRFSLSARILTGLGDLLLLGKGFLDERYIVAYNGRLFAIRRLLIPRDVGADPRYSNVERPNR